jgi:hypothetical protein
MNANQIKIEDSLSKSQKEQLISIFGEQLVQNFKGGIVEKVNEKIMASLRVN